MTGSAREAAARQALLLAKLFDLRTFIGALLLLFGIVVTVEGATADAAAIAKAADWNVSLWSGAVMALAGVLFIAWMFASPPSLPDPTARDAQPAECRDSAD
jgi:hypothetical protein